jgi:hypothetical protein
METTTMTTTSLDLPAARRLRDALTNLLRQEQAAMADFLVALADFDRHRGWEPLGHASLFAFLRAGLGLSSGAAFWRMSAARLLQRFPDVIEPLRDGRLCLSTTAELAKVLREENLGKVLPRFFGLSAREAKDVVAELQPSEMATASAPSTERREEAEPLTADLRRLHVTVSRRFLKKLDAARDGLSHQLRAATPEQVLEAALDLLLEKQARARCHWTSRPSRSSQPNPHHLAAPAPARRSRPR